MQILAFHYAPHRSWKMLAALPLVGIAVALLGPFGSYTSMNLLSRCLHFGLCFMLIGAVIIEGSYVLARRFFAGYWPLWAALVMDLVLCLPAAGVVYGSLRLFGKGTLAYIHFYDLIWQNLLISLMVRAVIVAMALFQASQLLQAPQPPSGQPDFPLADRLPFALKGAGVLALSSEDHYLRVYTARGEALIHMTLNEAIDLLGGGFRIHRSHWIAGVSIRDYNGNDVHLTTGLSLPLSRHRRKAFEDWVAEAGIMPA